MEPFTIAVRPDVLDDLRTRLDRSRFSVPSAPGWAAGADEVFLRALVDHWAHGFDWPAAERRLNSGPGSPRCR